MVTHVVMWKLKDRSEDNARRVQALVMSMRGRIPGMLELDAGIDYTRSERSFDVVLITKHENRAALEQYQVHPVHEEVKSVMLQLRDVSVAVDFES
jgi:Stress responsive A/B Barrel Domain